jgi:ribosomal protein L11 methyltransferase
MNSEPHVSAADTQLAVLETDEQSARRVSDLFAESFPPDEIAVSLVDIGQGAGPGQTRWRVTVFFRELPDETGLRELAAVAAGPEAAKALRLETMTAKDWVRESLAGLKPVSAGRFLVHGAHDRETVPPNRIGIEIEAALAFGTGHHGTTRGCLLALDRICKSFVPRHPEERASHPEERASKDVGRILDVGTGTGVLAIAAARVLRQGVLATDIDAASVRVARDNARLNRAGMDVTFLHANGVTAPAIYARAPFDLVFANILLGPLKRLAAPIRRVLAPGGRIVLSGILNAQANAVLAAYRPLTLERRIALDGWTTLVLRRKERSAACRSDIAQRRHEP